MVNDCETHKFPKFSEKLTKQFFEYLISLGVLNGDTEINMRFVYVVNQGIGVSNISPHSLVCSNIFEIQITNLFTAVDKFLLPKNVLFGNFVYDINQKVFKYSLAWGYSAEIDTIKSFEDELNLIIRSTK